MFKEPSIYVNGELLSDAQAMTVRVAIETFAMDLEEGLGDDEAGKAICAGYKKAIVAVRKLMGYGD